MNDWQEIVVEELKAINRKLERIEGDFREELDPIKRHVAQVKLAASLVVAAGSIVIGVITAILA